MNRKVRINLLPPELAGKAGKTRASRKAPGAAPPGANPLFILIAIVAFGAAIYGCYSFYAKWQGEKDKLEAAKKELIETEKEVAETREKFREFIETRDLILALAEVLDSIDPPNRIIWAEKLLMIADLIPANVYVTQIKIIEKEQQVITEESKRAIEAWQKAGSQGPKPEEVKKPIIHQELTLSALASQDVAQEQFTPILALLNSMQSYSRKRQDGSQRRFMENFVGQPTYGDIKATTYEGVSVFQFSIFLKTKPLSAQQEEVAEPGATPPPPVVITEPVGEVMVTESEPTPEPSPEPETPAEEAPAEQAPAEEAPAPEEGNPAPVESQQ